MTKPSIFQIRLLVETDDEDEVERLADAVGLVVCPQDDLSPGHACRSPGSSSPRSSRTRSPGETCSTGSPPKCRSTRFHVLGYRRSRVPGSRCRSARSERLNRHDASVHGSDALNEIARRLAHDLGTRFPGMEVRFDERAER